MATDVTPDAPTARPGRHRRDLASVIGSVGMFAVAVGVAIWALGGSGAEPTDAQQTVERTLHGVPVGTLSPRPGRSQALTTRFGELAVHPPRFVAGVGAKALSGRVHGIQDYVPPARQLVQVPITLYNATDEPVRYDASHFSLAPVARTGREGTPIGAASSSLYPGRLQPGASIEGVLGFVAPRKGARLVLLYHEQRAGVHRIPLPGTGSLYRPAPGDRADHGTSARRPGQRHEPE